MSTKEVHIYNHWFQMLLDAVDKNNGDVTAGQVAKVAGTARSTARRWLDRMVEKGAVRCDKHLGKNGFGEYRYNWVNEA